MTTHFRVVEHHGFDHARSGASYQKPIETPFISAFEALLYVRERAYGRHVRLGVEHRTDVFAPDGFLAFTFTDGARPTVELLRAAAKDDDFGRG